jgi:hypothetical protein
MTGVNPIGLTGRSRACAMAATRRAWVTPHPLLSWTTSSASASNLTGLEQWPVLLEPGQVLAARHSGAGRLADGRHARGVPATDRFLDPGQFDGRLELADVPHGLRAVPHLVGVEHHGRAHGVLPHDVADRPQAADVVVHVPAALDLGAGEPGGGEALVDVDDLVVLQPELERGRVPGHEP